MKLCDCISLISGRNPSCENRSVYRRRDIYFRNLTLFTLPQGIVGFMSSKFDAPTNQNTCYKKVALELIFDMHVYLIELHILRGDISRPRSFFKVKYRVLVTTFDPVERETWFGTHVYIMKLNSLSDRVFSHHFVTCTGTSRIGKIIARFWLTLGI